MRQARLNMAALDMKLIESEYDLTFAWQCL